MINQKHRFLLISSALLIFSNTAQSQTPPYPPSPVIDSLRWDSSANIIRMGLKSDGWPMTWADDNNLYTTFGDGWGFQPHVPIKLSLGFAKIIGSPPNLSGINIRSGDEQTGNGEHGKKASGILMVDNVLYMWVRNADNNGKQCQLAWSTDHGLNWMWSSWTFADLGYLTFINYGKNYSGSRDKYVYSISHDNPSAYVPADRFVLLRVPKDQMMDKNQYEFFKGVNSNNEPIWTFDFNQREAIFTNLGKCKRSGISYNAGIGRYLWWHQDATVPDSRFTGGVGIYDAPEPWGPWTTVYYTDLWDVGPGEMANFPTKWMSAAGDTIYLVFSGDDAFSVRKAVLSCFCRLKSKIR